MDRSSRLSAASLALDPEATVTAVAATLREQIRGTLRRRGAVVGLSGGIDSTVTAALCARALGRERVLGLLMPERESSAESTELGLLAARHLGIETVTEDVSELLAGAGAYERRDTAIRRVIPDYESSWRIKLVLADVVARDAFALTSLVAEAPSGERHTVRLGLTAYLEVVAATNFKQRARKMMEYFHADRLNYAVIGTPNRLEHALGFFVKNGDGAADVKPIAHLYKTQVYALADHLGLPEEIRQRPPTTDTYSLPQSQEEFYFALPYHLMDLCLYAYERSLPAEDVAAATGLSVEQAGRVFHDIESKRRAAAYLAAPPLVFGQNAG